MLESGGISVPFKAQLEALSNIRLLIHMQAGGTPTPLDVEVGSVSLRRPVFTKVRAGERQAATVELNNMNDPYRSARKVVGRWRIDHIVDTYVRRPNGANMRIVPDALKRGNFVEVSVTLRTHTVVTHKRHGPVVELWMHDVVRLWSAKEAKV
ncbi:hypothetical protein TRAPUB_9546 [Trametes pubescens]|uniref:Uncharacterized protein n=1 Tax=Trametes pubescens TaxID=154538 RepID=A0A1M2W1Z3_TRAPU|nr:hypothetical protein TRAPUB_9546 [Trametes pubescens]